MTVAELTFWQQVLYADLPLQKVQAILQQAGDFEQALTLDQATLVQYGLSKNQAHRFREHQSTEALAAWLEKPGHALLRWQDDAYPSQLKALEDAPPLLFAIGDVGLLQSPQLAIVGGRHATREGLRTAEEFSRALSEAGLTITSGLAHGIDAAAHRGALHGVGSTVAVLGTGIDRIYPAANKPLAHEIAAKGLIVSEFPLGTRPLARNFPRRNRIVSGLSLGTLVVEAAEQSGSLITARLAMQQGREVFAIPGSIHNPMAKGCHRLIKQGATLVESPQEVLEGLSNVLQAELTLETSAPGAPQALPADAEQRQLLSQLDFSPVSLDELAVLTKWPVSTLQSTLLGLELEGWIEALPGNLYKRVR